MLPIGDLWGGIINEEKTSLIRINGRLSVETYVDKILMPHVFPFIVRHPATDVMHDNAPSHRSRAATQSLIGADVTVLVWPAVSPDFNPIRHVIWGFMKQEPWKRPRASNSNELFQILEDIWGEIDLNFIKSLINSM